jgi:deazaflavin-dependent oxidoreductase (nitroreductase family)
MRIPEPLFVLINPTMRILLRSPLHGLASGSLMLITFTGRKSGRRHTTPVRYLRRGDTVRCFTSCKSKWWHNLKGGAAVSLRIRGHAVPFQATAIHDDPTKVRAGLEEYLREFPQDAAYHDIRLVGKETFDPTDLERAAKTVVMVEARPL